MPGLLGSEEVVFYSVCNSDFFLGLVVLINSLRLLGHNERVVVLDCGLLPEQVAILSGHCTLVRLAVGEASDPMFYKPFAHLLEPRGIAIILDDDMIVTSRLDGVVSAAREGKICAFANPDARWFEEWKTIFGMEKPLRRQPYVTTSFVAFSNERWPRLIGQWWSYCKRVCTRPTVYQRASNEDPVSTGDQDALNALLSNEYPQDALLVLPDIGIVQCSMQPSTPIDVATLQCSFQGERPLVLHWPGRPKPWHWRGRDWRGWIQFSTGNPFVAFMHRLLTWDDVAIKVPAHALPLRLRPGLAGALVYSSLGTFMRTMNPARLAARTSLYRLQHWISAAGAHARWTA